MSLKLMLLNNNSLELPRHSACPSNKKQFQKEKHALPVNWLPRSLSGGDVLIEKIKFKKNFLKIQCYLKLYQKKVPLKSIYIKLNLNVKL